jgi:bacterioferritin-associated ferredoxin
VQSISTYDLILLKETNMNNGKHRKDHKSTIVCLCNSVSKETIEKAISEGANTLNKIFDATTAGVGPCGGSCRRKLAPMLEHYLKTGTFKT